MAEFEKRLTTAGAIKKGDTIVIDDAPCKVVDIQISKPGKHGHAKSRIEGVGVIDDKKRVIVVPSHEKIEVPVVEKKNAQVLAVSGNKAQIMDLETYETFDLEIPPELQDKVVEGVKVLYWVLMGAKMMKQAQ